MRWKLVFYFFKRIEGNKILKFFLDNYLCLFTSFLVQYVGWGLNLQSLTMIKEKDYHFLFLKLFVDIHIG